MNIFKTFGVGISLAIVLGACTMMQSNTVPTPILDGGDWVLEGKDDSSSKTFSLPIKLIYKSTAQPDNRGMYTLPHPTSKSIRMSLVGNSGAASVRYAHFMSFENHPELLWAIESNNGMKMINIMLKSREVFGNSTVADMECVEFSNLKEKSNSYTGKLKIRASNKQDELNTVAVGTCTLKHL